MAWQTPKTDWGASDGVRDTDFNRIEGDILHLYNTESVKNNTTIHVNGTVGNDTTGDGSYSAPFATIMAAILSIPKVLNGYVVEVYIAEGTYDETVNISSFAGQLVLTGSNGAAVYISSVIVNNSTVQVGNIALTITGNSGLQIINNATLNYTSAYDLSINGSASGITGVSLRYGSALIVGGVLNVTGNGGTALSCMQCSSAYLDELIVSGKANAIDAYNGGIVHYNSLSGTVTGTRHFTATGGRIYTGAQTSVANY